MTSFQRALLGTIIGIALVFALLYATKQVPAPASFSGGGGAQGALAGPLGPSGGPPAPGIVVGGDATVKALPDVAILSIGVTTQAKTAGEAQSALNDRIATVLQRARELKLPDKDTKNSGYSINPQYAGGGPDRAPTITGYQANQTITLTLRDVTAVGKALDTFVQGDGATNVQLRFALDDPKPKQAEARKLAIEDARVKAKAMAEAAGVRLGRVLSLSESSSGPGPFFDGGQFQKGATGSAGASVPVGDLDVVVRVQVQFAIE